MRRIPNLNPIKSAQTVNGQIVVTLTDGEIMTLFEANDINPEELIGKTIFEAGSLFIRRQLDLQPVLA